jgi:hypothetical protein
VIGEWKKKLNNEESSVLYFMLISPSIVNQFLKMFQQDETFLYSILFPANSSICFGSNIHPSSGARINCSYSIS